MRTRSSILVVCALAGCTGSTIDAGSTSDAGGAGQAPSQDGAAATPTIIASEIQPTPTNLVSDGTSVYWVSASGTGSPISSVPVLGGAIQTVVPGNFPGGFLAVDDVNVYYVDGTTGGVDRAPKGGQGTPSAVTDENDGGVLVGAMTVFGPTLYWTEVPPLSGVAGAFATTLTVKSTPLLGGSISVVAVLGESPPPNGAVPGITGTTGFISTFAGVQSFPLGGFLDGGMPPSVSGAAGQCEALLSDTDAVYCVTDTSITRIANDGTVTTLGSSLNTLGSGAALDDTYVYWVDTATVGTIMRVPKTGGTPVILARDTGPVAIAVDSTAVYWADEGGNIMRLAK
jgi:hypothetical protein